MNAVVPDRLTLAQFRAKQWGDSPVVEILPQVFSLLAHAPRAGRDFLDMHELDARQRIERVIATCTLALQERPNLAQRLRPFVPLLAQEKLRRSGFNPDRAAELISNISKNTRVQSYVENT